MHNCQYTDRIEMQRGQLTRIVTAHWKDKSLDVYKRDETGRDQVRNLYSCMMGGYGVAFPGEKTYSRYPDIQSLDPWSKPIININSLRCEAATFRSLGLVTEKYPDFRYVLQKCELTSDEIIRVLPIWKKHPEVELLLASGYKKIVFSKKFYILTAGMKKKVINFLRLDAPRRKDYSISDALLILKKGISADDFIGWNAINSAGRYSFSYDEYQFLRGKKNSDVSLYADYLKMLRQTTHSIDDDYWHYPKRIARMHDKIRNEIDLEIELKIAEKIKQKQKEYFKSVKKYLQKKLITRSGISVYIPETVEDIQTQSKALNQCLITSDYISRVIKKQCVLVFIRNGDIPLATAEILPDGKIGQFYGNELDRENCLPPRQARLAMNRWLKLYAA